MTPKIERFFTRKSLATPCLVVDLDVIAANYKTLVGAFPTVKVYYAVKANPARPVLETLASLGSCFDAASDREVNMCLEAGADPANISFGATIKKRKDIAHAFAQGVRLYAFDSQAELEKLAEQAPGSKVYCRILVENTGSSWPLGHKFGCSLEMARDLILSAEKRGLIPYGVSFHVGSQQSDPGQWDAAIGRAAMVFADLQKTGVKVCMLNIGGGFPARYKDGDLPEIDAYAKTIMAAMRRCFGNAIPEMIMEPGRSIVGEAGVIKAQVILVSRKGYGPEEPRWVYLDVGKFGGLAEAANQAIRYPICAPGDGGPAGPVILAGPTCDGADVLYEKGSYQMPLDLKAGDGVKILSAGAYTACYASQGFNGFLPMKEFYI